ncbi:MAG: CapA family protein [Anaerolineae bacterium]|nr:CapA family protein [Anaerolineae bacterium]
MLRSKPSAAILLLLVFAGCQARPQPLTLALMGDLMLGRGVAQAYPDGDLAPALTAAQAYLQDADLALTNLESPLTSKHLPPSDYNLCAAPAALPSLLRAGFDILTLANNHQDDCAPGGAAQTASLLQDAGLAPVPPSIQSPPLYLPCQQWLCAVIAFDDITAPLDPAAAQGVIAGAAERADIVIVSVHWGTEYAPAPTQRQRALAGAFADSGADLIFGHHPHVLQPVEWLQGAGQPHPTLVAYSLGNALFDQSPPDARRTALLQVALTPAGVQSVHAVPLVISLPGWQLTPATGKDEARILERLNLP